MTNAMILQGNALRIPLPDNSVHCVVTSPPYWGLRDYGVSGQLGLEQTPDEFVANMVQVFREVRRVLRPDGTCWINIGDSYAAEAKANDKGDARSTLTGQRNRVTVGDRAQTNKITEGLKRKDLVGIPWMLAFALRADGWYLRQEIIWSKPNPMPESVSDRCTKAHESVFLLSKSPRYFYDAEAIAEPCSPATHARLSQNVQAQVGSDRAHGGAKSNGTMKAVGRRGVQPGNVPGNKSHKGTTAYESGDESHRTKGGLVEYAGKMRKLAEAGSGTKNNTSMDTALAVMPDRRNKRSVWAMTTRGFKEAHFATFPPELPETCILAGTSAYGVCAECGVPYERLMERSDVPDPSYNGSRFDTGKTVAVRKNVQEGERFLNISKGWAKSCNCSTDERKPATVLDPFNGAATTGLVALENNRNYIGIELNPEYIGMSMRRLGNVQPALIGVAW